MTEHEEIRMDEIEALRRRAEKAERERDEARRIHAANVEAGIELAKEFNRVGGIGYEVDGVFIRARALLSLFRSEKAARERAKADNAALLVQARRMEIGGVDDECVWCGNKGEHRPKCPVGLMLAGDHPGAALLERLRVLEEALRDIGRHVGDCSAGRIRSIAADALEPKR